MGLAEVARIEARYKSDVCTPLGFADFATFVAHAKSEPQFIAATSDALLDVYRDTTRKIAAKLPDFFTEFPRSDLIIVAADKGPAACMLS